MKLLTSRQEATLYLFTCCGISGAVLHSPEANSWTYLRGDDFYIVTIYGDIFLNGKFVMNMLKEKQFDDELREIIK